MQDNKNTDNAFWDLGRLIAEKRTALGADKSTEIPKTPPVPTPPPPPPAPRRISLTPISDSYREEKRADTAIYAPEKLPNRDASGARDPFIVESARPLILSVRLTPSGGVGRSFVLNAEKYFNAEGTSVPFTDFYAYSPTYANFTVATFKYYLWWRTNFRQGVSLKASWSYLSIYISELINCKKYVTPKEAAQLLWRLFESYADVKSPVYINDALCKLPEIICDHMLINSLGIPEGVSEETVLLAVGNARLREVFFEHGNDDLFARLLIASCSEYEFRKSKFAGDIVNPDSEKYVKLALLECIKKAKREQLDHPLAGSIKEVTTVSRHSYSNYVYVSPEYLCTITVDFCSVNRSYTLRNSISGIVKQCENNLRMLGGIKPRLKVFSLEPIFRDTVDSFFAELFPPEKRKKQIKRVKEAELPEYEKLYEHESGHVFSLANAKKIEERSWDVVEKLVEAIETDTPPAPNEEHTPSRDTEKEAPPKEEATETEAPANEENSCPGELAEILSSCPDCREFLFAVYEGNMMKARSEADKKGIPMQVLADTVNAAAFDVIGDILIDGDGDSFSIISDYEYIFCE